MDFYKANRQAVGHLVNFFVGITELLLILRVILKFAVARADSAFVHWAFTVTNVLLEPFRGVFPNPTHSTGSWWIDFPALFAMAVYASAGYLVIAICRWATVEKIREGGRGRR